MIRVSLVGVRVEVPTNQPIVLLREQDGQRHLPIFIGPPEATAIAACITVPHAAPPPPVMREKNVSSELPRPLAIIASGLPSSENDAKPLMSSLRRPASCTAALIASMAS